MKRVIKKAIDIGIGVIVLAILLLVAGWPITRVRVYMTSELEEEAINEYKNYYFKSRFVKTRSMPSPFGGPDMTDIYFLPGQKENTLNKIKEDIYNYLDTLVKEHGDIFYKYEIDDDFKHVRIYQAVFIDGSDSGRDWRYDSKRLVSLMALHHYISGGTLENASRSHIVELVEPITISTPDAIYDLATKTLTIHTIDISGNAVSPADVFVEINKINKTKTTSEKTLMGSDTVALDSSGVGLYTAPTDATIASDEKAEISVYSDSSRTRLIKQLSIGSVSASYYSPTISSYEFSIAMPDAEYNKSSKTLTLNTIQISA